MTVGESDMSVKFIDSNKCAAVRGPPLTGEAVLCEGTGYTGHLCSFSSMLLHTALKIQFLKNPNYMTSKIINNNSNFPHYFINILFHLISLNHNPNEVPTLHLADVSL